MGGFVLASAVHRAPGIPNVGEDAGRSEEDVVVAQHAVVQAHVVLDLDVASQAHRGGHVASLAQARPCAEARARHDVRKMPNLDVGPEMGAFVDDGGFMDECGGINQGKGGQRVV